MDIDFISTKLEKLCNDRKKATRKWGPITAALLGRRLDQLNAADCLDDMPRIGPGRCHELKGSRKGQISVDLEHPMRLIFEPANEPIPTKDGGGLDRRRVTAVRILKVEDTHG